MFCLYCGKKFDGAVFICESCGNANKLEPFAPHIKVRPKALSISCIAREKVVIKASCKNFRKVTLTNKRIIAGNFFSTRQFNLQNIKYAEYTRPDRSDFFRGGLVGYLSKKFFSDGITFFGEGDVKLLELKRLDDAGALLRAFYSVKSGVTPIQEISAMPEYSGGGFISAVLSAIENISGAGKGTERKSFYNETSYLAGVPNPRRPKVDSGDLAKGISSFEAGDFEKSELALKKYCDANPRDEDGFIFRAAALDNLGRFDEAILLYDRALAINPASFHALKMQAYSLYRAARYRESCDNFEKASALYSAACSKNSGSSAVNAVFFNECAFGAASCHHKTGNLNDAIGRLEAVIDHNDDAAAWIKKGFCHQELGEHGAAGACHDAAAKITRDGPAVLFYSAAARYEAGAELRKEAQELFLACARSAPLDSDLKAAAEAALSKMSDGTLISWIKKFFIRR